MDHAGSTLYSESQMEAVLKDLTTSVYGNPRILLCTINLRSMQTCSAAVLAVLFELFAIFDRQKHDSYIDMHGEYPMSMEKLQLI